MGWIVEDEELATFLNVAPRLLRITCVGIAVMDTILDYGHDTLEQQRFLEKHRLVRLKLGWELKALSLDGARLRSNDPAARAEAKAAADAYRQCIADLASVVGGSLG
jgi:sensor domain CHASE-containing protein